LFAKSPFRREINLHVHRRAGSGALQARAQHGKHGSFFRLQSPDFFAQLFFNARLDFQREIAIEIRVQHFRMDVTLSADGSGVAEPGGDVLDCGADVSFRLRCAIEKRAKKFQWTEVAPVHLDRFARWAGEIIARGASRRTPKKPRRRPLIPRGAELRTLARVPVGSR
jgi:hypothetical protein